MKIVVLGTRGFPQIQGGVETHCENLYPQLVKMGCEVVVFTRRPYAKPACDNYKGVKLIPLPCLKNKFLEAFLHTLYGVFAAKKASPDILHIHAIGPSLFILLARLLGLKVVMTNHGPDYERKKWRKLAKIILKFGEYLGSKWANSIICISQSIADNVNKKYHREVTVIPNGVIMPQILQKENILRKYALDKGKYILSVGRFVPEKGFHDLIDAFKLAHSSWLTAHSKDWKLVIVGDADHPDRYSLGLKEKASKNNNVILTGFLTGEPLRELYSHAGLFVLPSYYEGLPIVLLEAMSYGLLCLASNIPANCAIGLPDENYFTVGNIEQLFKKLQEFIKKPISAEQKSRQIEMLRQKYDWDEVARNTLEVYRKVVNV